MAPSFKKRLAETAVNEETTVEYRLDFLYNQPTLRVAPLIAEYNKPFLNDVLRRRKEPEPVEPGQAAKQATADDAAREDKENEDRLVDALARFAIRDWSGLIDDDDNEVPYSAETAAALMSDIRDTHKAEVIKLAVFVQSLGSFAKQPRMRPEVIAKNS